MKSRSLVGKKRRSDTAEIVGSNPAGTTNTEVNNVIQEHFEFTTKLDVDSHERLDDEFIAKLHEIRKTTARQVAELAAKQQGIIDVKVNSRPFSWISGPLGEFEVR